MMKNKRFALIVLLVLFASNAFSISKREDQSKPLKFEETWGYVAMTRSGEYKPEMPITDLCYFSADVNCYGELIDIPEIDAIDAAGKRTHMVFICDSKSLTHFVLSPEYSVRENIINQLCQAVEPFDGLNIDLELVPARDRNLFLAFVAELRARLPGKILSVCVPARVKRLSNDIYPYKEIAEVCDRVFIMAYDQHWSGGPAGPIASPDWCQNVTAYALKAIPREKVIMGIPFYGRTWADKSTSGAWYFTGAQRVMDENDVDEYTYENGIPTFSYTTEVTVTGYFNDVNSIYALAHSYKKDGVNKIGYWRIGQEDPEVWDCITID